jgi:hypothetical protein
MCQQLLDRDRSEFRIGGIAALLKISGEHVTERVIERQLVLLHEVGDANGGDSLRQARDRVGPGGIPSAIAEALDHLAVTPDRNGKLLYGVALSPRRDDLAHGLIAGKRCPRLSSGL